MEIESQNQKALHEVIKLVIENCYMQTMGFDVGIPFICGAPGGGKTASLHYLSTLYDFAVISTHLALKPLEETGGIPQFEKIIINNQELLGTIWSFPDIMKKLYELSEQKRDKIVIWLLDDAHLLSPVHMALLYELFTERTLRGYKIPNNCAMVMAGNTSSKSGAKTLFSAIVNRCVLMPVYTDFEGWKNNFALREDVQVHPAIISFLSNHQFRKFFHEEEQVDQAWGSPRSWTRFATEISNREKWYQKTVDSDVCLYLGTGYVGKEAASEFTTYYKIFIEFDMESIIASATDYKLPEDPVKKYALAYALVTYYTSRENKTRITPNLSYLITLFMKEAPELAIMIIKEMKQYETANNKKNIVNNILANIQKIEPNLTKQILQDLVSVS